MPLLDLGFSSLEAYGAVAEYEDYRLLNHTWMCDWELVSFMDKIDLVYDATMYRMYCAEYDKNCDYSDEECVELVQKYKEPISVYQRTLLKNVVATIYNRYFSMVEKGEILPKLPKTAKVALLNFINIVKHMVESEYAPHFVGMYGSLAEAHKEKTTFTTDISSVQETITKDQFISYCNIVRNILFKPFDNNVELDSKMFNTRISMAQKVLTSILWMCEPYMAGRVYDSASIFDNWIEPFLRNQPMFKQYINKCQMRKGIPLAYAICVTPETIECIPEDKDSYPTTDAYRLMLTLLFINNTIQRQ